MAYPKRGGTELRNIQGQVPAEDRAWVEEYAGKIPFGSISEVIRLAIRELRYKAEQEDR